MNVRITNIQKQLHNYGIDGLLITKKENRQYATNFTGSAGVVLIAAHKAIFITDFRYVDQAKTEIKAAEIIMHKGNLEEEVANQVSKLNIQKLGIEDNNMTLQQFKKLQKYIHTEMVPVCEIIEDIRLIKDTSEIETMKIAATIADEAFHHIVTFLKPGISETDVRDELEFFMRKKGATSSSFQIIVASGVRSSLPHGVASNKIIERGDIVTLDFGALYDGYCSDITRTVAIGEPSEKFQKIYNVVREALKRGTEAIKPGETAKSIDDITRNYITEHGYGQYFGHSTGHGLGLEIHEPLRLSQESKATLQEGMVVTVEPGIYIPNWGGCRIEDDIVITKDGYDVITKSNRELIIIPC
ncbi:M24 family metallopeptidase [Bacillus thuringiensis]|uniref:M24 family metallopeptidase n=1 Tax=Bacillus thuringiensis TaxID=1428 RepID=UPI0021D69C34|nr:Xaa-Pro peptidase family protein [Bacillus thuringiensis]MCU7675018.1 Xaa-Pro peptidase family protein [Bacillus thuringiensis]MED2788895.1 Xaa-Pro peptidase family protein [Bacillus thuringiensis]MED2811014.1 Xaa-Pro peptidase family protein [Bacillus thuringiensis]MED2826820.1 Xaa-Pro peptidase family protein [Bacillus thuringiensis]MED2831907.1 Xaa-Pro peptidase family protein [Bacillus thuringiensis]